MTKQFSLINQVFLDKKKLREYKKNMECEKISKFTTHKYDGMVRRSKKHDVAVLESFLSHIWQSKIQCVDQKVCENMKLDVDRKPSRNRKQSTFATLNIVNIQRY